MHLDSVVGADALLGLFDSIQVRLALTSNEVNEFSRLKTNALYGLRMRLQREGGDLMKILVISVTIADREIEYLQLDPSEKAFTKATLAIVSLLRSFAENLDGNRSLPASARAMSRDLLSGFKGLPKWAEAYRITKSGPPKIADVLSLTGYSQVEWSASLEAVRKTAENPKTLLARLSATSSMPAPQDDLSEMLSRLVRSNGDVAEDLPAYDSSEKGLRLCGVSVSGFRGSPGEITLDLTKSGKPTSVLLWGDNGVGKSTIVDGIEFALQGRNDRSADFNSSLRPSIRNVTSSAASADVTLSDGTHLNRALDVNEVGRLEATPRAVRPGFRIAPVVIRRSDILRFLDSETLTRGTVFFDYFSDPAGSLGQRPDEELRMLEEERFSARVVRADLARELDSHFPSSGYDFTDASNLERFVKQELFSGVTGEAASKIWDELDEGVRRVISLLRDAQSRGQQIKKKLENGVQALNPVAYRNQLARITPVLHRVGGDLTASFLRITRAPHVASIRVLVGVSGPLSLDVVVRFTNGKSGFPQQVFSEGYKDLIALLFFLTVTKQAAEHGQARVLVLDDVLQSVDASVRVDVMDFVLDEFKDWQLIITGHDRGWHEQLRSLFQHKGIPVLDRRITRWSFDGGLTIAETACGDLKSLEHALERSDSQATASAIGILMEQIAQELSWRLQVRVIRKREDKYTLADLWNGVRSALKKTELRDVCDDIDKRLVLRNMLGAHYNAWAASVPWNDIQFLGQKSKDLYQAVHCNECGGWIAILSSYHMACQCGKTTVQPGIVGT